jgi:hypothetical protein
MDAAIGAGHPGQNLDQLPEPMKNAAEFITTRSPQEVAQHRSEVLRKMIHRAAQLADREAALKGDMSGRRRAILEKKRLLLFKELLVEAGSNDVNLVEDICNGFDLTGKLPESNQFDKKFRPVALPTACVA